MTPIDLIIYNFTIWENRDKYIEIIENFVFEDPLNDRINRENLNIQMNKLHQKCKTKKYNWEQVGLRFPKDNEQIVKQASFANTILRVSNYDNYYRFETIEEANKQFREQVQIEFLHLTNLIHQN